MNALKTEPAITIGVLAAVIVSVASIFNVVIDLDTVQTIALAVYTILTALGIRQNVFAPDTVQEIEASVRK